MASSSVSALYLMTSPSRLRYSSSLPVGGRRSETLLLEYLPFLFLSVFFFWIYHSEYTHTHTHSPMTFPLNKNLSYKSPLTSWMLQRASTLIQGKMFRSQERKKAPGSHYLTHAGASARLLIHQAFIRKETLNATTAPFTFSLSALLCPAEDAEMLLQRAEQPALASGMPLQAAASFSRTQPDRRML